MGADRFGAFDGRFFGISLDLTGAEQRSALPWFPPAVTDPDAVAGLLGALDPTEALEALLEASSPAHELRHFHDFLLSPLGSYVARARYLATINATPLLLWLASQPGVVPVPISDWIVMPDDEREDYWSRAAGLSARVGRSLGRPLRVPFSPEVDTAPLPEGNGGTMIHLDEDSAGQTLLLIAGQLARPKLMMGALQVEDELWTPAQLFEANGLLTQLQQLRLVAGQEVADGVAKVLITGGSSYSTVLGRIYHALGTGADRIAYPHLLAVCTYALLGSCEPRYFYGQPVARFLAVAAHVQARGGVPEIETRDLFAEWDEVLEHDGLLTAPTFAGLEASLEMDTKLSNMAKGRLAEVNGELTYSVRQTLQKFVEARRRLCRRFLEDPDSYLRPKLYLQRLGDLPRPAVRVNVSPGNAEAAQGLLERSGWSQCEANNGTEVLSDASQNFLPGGEEAPLSGLALATELLMATETLFADNPVVTDAGTRFLESAFGGRVEMMRVFGPRAGTRIRWDGGVVQA